MKPELSENWRTLLTDIQLEKWKKEERRLIISEEWRHLSQIFDRFIFLVLLCLSLINTFWCLYRSVGFNY